MKNIQLTTPGFVLTSLSFKIPENKKPAQANSQHKNGEHKSSITKFDYCLPPEEINNLNGSGTH